MGEAGPPVVHSRPLNFASKAWAGGRQGGKGGTEILLMVAGESRGQQVEN